MGRPGNTFCPRRAAEGHGERQRQHLLSTEGRGGARRTATATPFVHGGPRRGTENGNGNTFCSRRAAKGRGERQRQHPFVHEGPRRAAENGNGNTLLSTKGREGPRRTATATPFCPRRAAKDREERQRQHPFVHEGPRRTAKNTFLDPRRVAEDGYLLIHGGRGERSG